MHSTRTKPVLREIPDGEQLLNSYDAALLAQVSQDVLHKWVQRGHLHPAKYGRDYIFTRSEVLAVRNEVIDRRIAKMLNDGASPLQVWESLPMASPDRVVRVLRGWARLSGVWIVDMPPGSYARWLARWRLKKFTPTDLRRCIERLLETGPQVR